MAKKLLASYTFTPGAANAGTVVVPGTYTLEQFLLITNVSSGTTIYQFNVPSKGATLSTGGGNTTLTLELSTLGMSGADRLQVFIDDLSTGGGGLTDAELRATPVPMSVAGVATAANQTTGNSSLSSIDGKLPALVSGRLPVDGSGVTQPVSGPLTDTQLRATAVPVSGTVTANAGTNLNTSALALETGGNLASLNTKVPSSMTVKAASTAAAATDPALVVAISPNSTVNVATHAVTQSGTFTVAQGTAAATPWLARINDGTNSAAIKAASTAAIATDPSLVVALSPNTIPAVTQSGTWTVQPGNTANTTPWLSRISDGTNAAAIKAASTAAAATDPSLVVALSPNSASVTVNNITASTTSSGTTLYTANSAATTNAASIKASAGNLYGVSVMNASAATRYVRLFNLATAPTVGTSVPIMVIAVPATSSKELQYVQALRFGTGLAVAITGGAAATDATAVAAGDVQLLVSYA